LKHSLIDATYRRRAPSCGIWINAMPGRKIMGEGPPARARRHLPAEPGAGAARGCGGDRFLCSDAAGSVNGEAITVALGGMW